jgi:hypothetical protein
MAVAEDNERVQVVVSKKDLAKIDDLARRLHMTRTAFLSALVSISVDDQETLIKLVAGFVDFVKGLKGKGKRVEPEGA